MKVFKISLLSIIAATLLFRLLFGIVSVDSLSIIPKGKTIVFFRMGSNLPFKTLINTSEHSIVEIADIFDSTYKQTEGRIVFETNNSFNWFYQTEYDKTRHRLMNK